jgi:TatD DNase family protein
MAEFFDTHAHLDFPDFAADLEAVVDRATGAGISRIVCIGTTLAGSRRVVDLAARFPSVYAVVGVHPNHAHEEPDDIVPELTELARQPKVVGIGETGLDWYRLGDKSPEELDRIRAKQRSVYRQQLEVAAAMGLNCVIHQRDAFQEALSVLSEYRGRTRGVVHCFTASPLEAQQVLDAGSLVSFTGITTFKSAQNVRDALAVVPLGSFMLETDCPFLAPIPYRGKRCEPAFVRELAEAVAGYKGCTVEQLSQETCTTARGFFRGLK